MNFQWLAVPMGKGAGRGGVQMSSSPEKGTEIEELSLGKVGVKPFGERAIGGSGLGGQVVSQNGLFLRLQVLCTISIQMAPADL